MTLYCMVAAKIANLRNICRDDG